MPHSNTPYWPQSSTGRMPGPRTSVRPVESAKRNVCKKFDKPLPSAVPMPVDQMKDFQATSQKSAETVAKPMKDVFEKTVKELRVA